jgi:hypothetical protein
MRMKTKNCNPKVNEREDRDESDDRFENEASVRLGHKSLRTLMKRSSSWYLPGC